jgi:hypothetical protein
MDDQRPPAVPPRADTLSLSERVFHALRSTRLARFEAPATAFIERLVRDWVPVGPSPDAGWGA